MIRALNLHKTYESDHRPLEVLRGINLEIQSGEKLAILGASGSGKSTLLHLLGTLDRPTSGQVLYEDRDIFALGERDLSRFRNRSIGFVFQFHHLIPMLTALENTQLPCMIAGVSRKEAGERARELLSQVGLSHRLGHRPSQLSGGEQQRVAIARALVLRPKVLLADEPTGNLDSQTGEEISKLLLSLGRTHSMTLIVVTHNEGLAAQLDRRILLSDGNLVE